MELPEKFPEVDGKRTRADLELPGKCPEVKGKESRDLVAEKSGFGSAITYQQANETDRSSNASL